MSDMLYTTPVGRIIEGSVHTASDIGYQRQKLAKPRYFFALAVSKNNPQMQSILQMLWTEACTAFGQNPYVMSNIQKGFAPDTNFSWKVSDGDSPKYHDKPLYRGNWVFKFSSAFPIAAFNPQNTPMDLRNIERGYWASVIFNVRPNGKMDGTAGLYMNPQAIRLERLDEIIRNAPQIDPNTMFGAPTPMPQQGAYAPPLAGPVGNVGNPPPAPAYGTYSPSMTGAAPGSPQYGYAPPVAPQPQPFPATLAPNGGYQPMPPAPPQQGGAPMNFVTTPQPQQGGAAPAYTPPSPPAVAPAAPVGATSQPAPEAGGTASPSNSVPGFAVGAPQLPQ